MKINAELGLGVRGKRLAAHRLTGLGLTQPHDALARRLAAKEIVEGDDAVDFGAREIEGGRQQCGGFRRDKAEMRLHGMQRRQQRARQGQQGR